LAIRAGFWTAGGYGASQVLRLGSSLILTRLLFPEAFGLMALAQVFMQGLQMFSDVGLGPAVVRDRRGDDPAFVNTAWTIQVIRGLALWGCTCLLAVPLARLFGEPMLTRLVPVAGITALIAGFNATSILTAMRHLRLGPVNLLELGSELVAISVMITWA
jgi:O-antigen/teichoic acid export membrane protein